MFEWASRAAQRAARAARKTARTFSLAVGATAVCMLLSLSVLDVDPGSVPAAEASVFNGGRSFPEAVEISQVGQSDLSGQESVAPTQVIPLGSVFGIKLFTDGVIVTSLTDIYTADGVCCPAAEAGVRPGDYVLAVNGTPVNGNQTIARLIGGCQGNPVTLELKRNGETFETEVTPVVSAGAFKTGMWVRDSAAGIGTLTFYDPASGTFAGLGHGICDADSGGVLSLKSGQPAPITLCGVVRGEQNAPGQLRGYFSSDAALGTLTQNNETGVYGTLNISVSGGAVQVLPREQVKEGPAQILASVDENGPRLYDVEITRVSAVNQRTKNMILRVTDPLLLSRTGGIVQGMSGCPILQNGQLAGAVTHVFTDNPAMGYGIFAQTMCEELLKCQD